MTPSRGTPFRPGSLLVVGLILLGVGAASVALWYQQLQTRRCLAFYGTAAARRITKAPHVELWSLAPSGQSGRLVVVGVRDVSTAKGIVHLRRGLVEDAGFRWADPGPAGRLPAAVWAHALAFGDAATPGDRTVVVLGLDPQGGWLAVAGQPGRVGLGRLGDGLATWLGEITRDASSP